MKLSEILHIKNKKVNKKNKQIIFDIAFIIILYVFINK